MRNKRIVNKILAVVGTVLVWLPVLSPFLAALRFAGRVPEPERPVNIDFLMPAELFPVVLLGGIFLIAAELLAGLKGRAHRRLVFWGLGAALVLLFVGQVLAVISGLASGETAPAGVWWVIVLGTLAVYVLGVAAAGIGGVLLLRDLFRPAQSAAVE